MIRLAVRVRRDQSELVLADLLALAPTGVEEVDVDDCVVEYAIYGAPGELADVGAVRAAAGAALVEVFTREVADDWGERWRRFHRPVTVAGPAGRRRVHVRPPWAPPPPASIRAGGASPEAGLVDLVVDPAQAFGTGAHPTTRLCLELLLALVEEDQARGSLCDVGSGSGVLAIAAAKLGWAPVVAIDHDPAAVAATRENAAANGVTLEVRRGDLRAMTPPAAATISANLVAPLLRELAARPPAPPPAAVVAGGLLASEAPEVARALARGWGLRERLRLSEGDWAAVLLSGP
ncbi:MAG: methyltransferase [Actinobacteria bacterium]|nr:MAG: methyltransferase [Actinomycetota bacterium]